MEDINKVLCKRMYEFVKEHVDEVTEKKDIFGHDVTYDDLGFKSKRDMLSQIKNDADIAYWALTELLVWGLAKDYCREMFVYEETDTFTVFRFFDSDVNQFIFTAFLQSPYFMLHLIQLWLPVLEAASIFFLFCFKNF